MNEIFEKGLSIVEDVTKEEILSKEIIRDIPHVKELLNGQIGSYIIAVFVVFILYIWFSNIQYFFRKNAVAKKVTLRNTMKFYKILCRFGISIQNHPKVWNELRSIFYNINRSSQIPTELKKN